MRVWMQSDQVIVNSGFEEASEDKSAEKSLESPDDEICVRRHQLDEFLCRLCPDKN